jgi:hypothetical protein
VKLGRGVARGLASVLLLSFLLGGAAYGGSDSPKSDTQGTARKSPEGRLSDGRLAYERGDYVVAVQTLVPLLYPSIELSTEEGVIEAHRLLALSYILQKKENEAEEEATSILALRPSFQLDPIVDPPTAVAFFETVRRRQADRLREARDRERREAEARAKADEEKRRAAAAALHTEPRLERRSRWVATVPFGVGQWQNGQPRKAVGFLSAELVLGVTSLSGFAAVQIRFPNHYYERPDLAHPNVPDERPLADALFGLQIGAGIAFWATVVWGVIDAHVLFKREVKIDDSKKVLKSMMLAPSIAPNQVGLGVQGAW